jgi:type II secretory pathway component PulF
MSAPLAGLEALADLCGAGRSPVEAVGILRRSGGPVGQWAHGLEGSLAGGVALGLVLAKSGSLSPDELAAVGGPQHAGTTVALQAVVISRRARGGRRRRMLAAMVLPGVMVLMTAIPTRFLAGMVGAGGGMGWLGDLLPFAVLVGLIWITGTDLAVQLGARLTGLPVIGPLVQRSGQARVTRLLGMGLGAGPPAPVFEATARLSRGPVAHALGVTARRLADGDPLESAGPPAERVGEGLALAIAVGAGAGDLNARLLRLADEEEAAVLAAAVRAVRFVAWMLVLWVSWRAMLAFGQVDLGQFQPGQVPGQGGSEAQQMQELMRELGM